MRTREDAKDQTRVRPGPARTLMIQGTGSNVGKSMLTTALCRIFLQDGFRVAPFKAQNMSNNAYVCADGGEIGRAQAVQAMACRVEPTVEMNPVLLKPCTDISAQVIVLGRSVGVMNAGEAQAYKSSLVPIIRECVSQLRAAYDLVVIEGAGSPAEINLREQDIVNMCTARIADAPVLLVGDIDFGGVFAQLVGTMHLLLPEERARVHGFVINKFRGDLDILKPGLEFLERETSLPVLGVLPYYRDIRLPEEDAVPWGRNGDAATGGTLRIDVVRHPRISNFTDCDPLDCESDVTLRYLARPDAVVPDAIILPGTKSTLPDLQHLKAMGFADHIRRCADMGTTIVGICGGFQMLGQQLLDPQHVESGMDREDGLGLLPGVTEFVADKTTSRVRAVHCESGTEISGYEIHMGRTTVDCDPTFKIVERLGVPVVDGYGDGAVSHHGRVWGTYIHGLFDSAAFRRHFLNTLRVGRGWAPRPESANIDHHAEIDTLAAHVRAHLDMPAVYRIIGLSR